MDKTMAFKIRVYINLALIQDLKTPLSRSTPPYTFLILVKSLNMGSFKTLKIFQIHLTILKRPSKINFISQNRTTYTKKRELRASSHHQTQNRLCKCNMMRDCKAPTKKRALSRLITFEIIKALPNQHSRSENHISKANSRTDQTSLMMAK